MFSMLLDTQHLMLCVLITTCTHSSNRTLVHLLKRWGLQCTVIPLETFTPQEEDEWGEDRVVIEGLSDKVSTEHTIHMWEIYKK